MSKYSQLRNIWCANEWVGAPWACGEARYDMPVENYENDVANSYEGWTTDDCASGSTIGCDKNITCGDGMERTRYSKCNNIKSKSHCEQGYDSSGRTCRWKNGKCVSDETTYCSNMSRCQSECGSTTAPTPTPTPGPTGGTCDELVSVFPSACDSNNGSYGCVVTSTDLYPWIGGRNGREGTDGVLYGFVAQYCGDNNCNSSSEGCTTGMGAVYEITFSSGKTGFVQVINCGDIDNSTTVFDFLVPGGGMGTKQGCANMPGWNMSGYCSYNGDTENCARYGGLYTNVKTEDVFPDDTDAQTAVADVLRNSDYFEQPTYVSNSGNAYLTSVQYIDPSSGNNAITILSALSGIKQSNSSQYVSNFSNGNMMMTHYWDCCKPNVVSNPPSNGSGDCPLGYRTASIINNDGTGFADKGVGNSSCISNYNGNNLEGGCCIFTGGKCEQSVESGGYCGKSASNCSDCDGVNAYFDSNGKIVNP